jgi:ATP-dependent exoDNAse (exonuclease V) alpha subunit
MLRNIYNPHGKDAVQLLRHEWDEKRPVTVSVGDKVVCTENTYDMRNYSDRFEEWDDDGRPQLYSFIPAPDTKYMLNGEVGIVLEVYPDTGLEVDLGDRVVEIPYQFEEWSQKFSKFFHVYPQRSIELAYALTTHKAQGSEYDVVIYLINKSVGFMLSRENLYTAVTRAKKASYVITDASSLTQSLRITREIVNKRQEARVKNAKSLMDPTTKSKFKKG